MAAKRKIFSNAELTRMFAESLKAGNVRGRTKAVKAFRRELNKKNESSKTAMRKALRTRRAR